MLKAKSLMPLAAMAGAGLLAACTTTPAPVAHAPEGDEKGKEDSLLFSKLKTPAISDTGSGFSLPSQSQRTAKVP